MSAEIDQMLQNIAGNIRIKGHYRGHTQAHPEGAVCLIANNLFSNLRLSELQDVIDKVEKEMCRRAGVSTPAALVIWNDMHSTDQVLAMLEAP